uniref:Uncharacterized protein n=1 Tax=Opuntia streptacantha TaxID=393608 RepID=A0A7C9CLX3_OPUST
MLIILFFVFEKREFNCLNLLKSSFSENSFHTPPKNYPTALPLQIWRLVAKETNVARSCHMARSHRATLLDCWSLQHGRAWLVCTGMLPSTQLHSVSWPCFDLCSSLNPSEAIFFHQNLRGIPEMRR